MKTDMNNIEHKVMLVTVRCLFWRHWLYQYCGWKLGNREPQIEGLQEMMLSIMRFRSGVMYFTSLLLQKQNTLKNVMTSWSSEFRPPSPSGWQTGRTFCNFYRFTSIKVAKLDVISWVTVFSIMLSNLKIKSHVKVTWLKQFIKAVKLCCLQYSLLLTFQFLRKITVFFWIQLIF